MVKKGNMEPMEPGPQDAYLEGLIGKCVEMFLKGDYKGAAECSTNLENKKPNLAVTRYYRGFVLFNNKEYGEALKVFDDGSKVDPKAWLMHNMKGMCLYAMGKPNDALKCFSEALKLGPNEVTSLTMSGICYMLLQDKASGETYLKKAFKIDPIKAFMLYKPFIEAVISSKKYPNDEKTMRASLNAIAEKVKLVQEYRESQKRKKK
jgi:tetratricopeptide (TPR) repeat protein